MKSKEKEFEKWYDEYFGNSQEKIVHILTMI